jgi:hypothetical protein
MRIAKSMTWSWLCGKYSCTAFDYIFFPLLCIALFLGLPFAAPLVWQSNHNVCVQAFAKGTCIVGTIVGFGYLIYSLSLFLRGRQFGSFAKIAYLLLALSIMSWNVAMWLMKPCSASPNYAANRALGWFDIAIFLFVFVLRLAMPQGQG